MRTITLLVMLLLVSCKTVEPTEGGDNTMKGRKVGGEVKAYEQMCARTPESVLCTTGEENDEG